MSNNKNNSIGVISLIAIIMSAMIGGGVFSLPTDMARNASIFAILIGWIITSIGMLSLASVYQILSKRKPNLVGGIYTYASEGFGKFVGFNAAWGYWLSAFLGNIAYTLLLFDALSFFFPIFLNKDNNIYILIGSSIIIWIVHAVALCGMRQAAIINIITTIARLIPLFICIIILLFFFNINYLSFKVFGTSNMGSILKQVTSTMMVTLWVFIGIEGAVVVSTRTHTKSDVGKATIIGLSLTIVIYIILNIITLAAIPRELLMQFDNPTLAYTLQYIVGSWGAWIINIGLCIALFGGLLSWTVLASETPYIASKDGIMPRFFSKVNKKNAPFMSLWITNICIQIFLVISYLSSSTYQVIYTIAAIAILPPYLLSTIYALKVIIKKQGYNKNESTKKDTILALISLIYAIWLIFAVTIQLLILCTILYFIGLFVYIFSVIRKEANFKLFNRIEWILVIIITLTSIFGILILMNKSIN